MNPEAPPARGTVGFWIWPVLLVLAAAAFLAVPIFECDLCHDLRKSINVSDVNAFTCPCCGTSLRLSLFHKWFGGHQGHLEEMHRDFTP